MVANKVKQLWGVEFSVVPEGLQEDQVVSFVNRLMEKSHNGGSENNRQSSLLKLAEQTVIEAHKLAESIKEQAVREAGIEVERIRADSDEKARDQAPAQAEASAKSNSIVAKAEQQARELSTRARREAQNVVKDANQRAEDHEAEARLEAEFKVRKLTARFTDEIRSAVTNISNNLLPSLEESVKVSDETPNASNGKASQPARHSGRVKAKVPSKR